MDKTQQERIKADAEAAKDKEAVRLRTYDMEYCRMVSRLYGYGEGYIAGATAENCRAMINNTNPELPVEVVQSLNALVKRRSLSQDYADGYKEGYIAAVTSYATKLLTAEEKIKVLEYDNTRLKGEVEGYREAVEELKKENKQLKEALQGLVDVLPKGESLRHYFAQVELIHARGTLLIYNDKK